MIDLQLENETLKLFRRSRIMTIVQLTDHLRCSVPTVRNRLKRWDTLTSYNHNGRYYALPEVVKFDECGLWKYKGVFFSQHGTLKSTIVSLVRNSSEGLDAAEIGRLTGLLPRSFMTQLSSIAGIRRQRYEKRFLYFSDDEHRYRSQRRLRTEAAGERRPKDLPSDEQAIQILVDCIKHPDSSVQECAQRLRKKGKGISIVSIRSLLLYHGIEKKTQDIASSWR